MKTKMKTVRKEMNAGDLKSIIDLPNLKLLTIGAWKGWLKGMELLIDTNVVESF